MLVYYREVMRKYWFLWALLGIIIAMIILGFSFPHFLVGFNSETVLYSDVYIHRIQNYLANLGAFVYPVFILFMITSGLTPVPDSPWVIASGAVFGWQVGLLLSMIGNALGFVINYFLVKKLGYTWVHQKFPQVVEMIEQFESKYGWQSILVFRMTPVLPFDWISYVCGLTKVNFWVFFTASLLGNLPGVLALTMVGAGVGNGSVLWLTTSMGVLGVVVLIGNILLHKNLTKK